MLKIFSCILCGDDVFFHFDWSKVLLIKDIWAIKNKIKRENKILSWLGSQRCFGWERTRDVSVERDVLVERDVKNIFMYPI